MKIKLHIEGERVRTCKLPYDDADHVIATGSCPACKRERTEAEGGGFAVAGVKGTTVRGHDTYTSEAGCCSCGASLGKLVVHISTIFGIEEDERVAQRSGSGLLTMHPRDYLILRGWRLIASDDLIGGEPGWTRPDTGGFAVYRRFPESKAFKIQLDEDEAVLRLLLDQRPRLVELLRRFLKEPTF